MTARNCTEQTPDQALNTLVAICRAEGKRTGDIHRELRAEIAAVHPEWTRTQRRAYLASFRRKAAR